MATSCKTIKDLMNEYGIKNYSTFHKWIEPIKECLGKKIGRYYLPIQVKKIIEHLGEP